MDTRRPVPGMDAITVCLVLVIALVLLTSCTMSTANRAVLTYGGNANGAPCVFPFNHIVYDKADGGWHVHLHQQCILEDRESLWCSTTEQYWDGRNTSKWGYCMMEKLYAVDTNGNRSACVFPFEYGGKRYPGCTDVNRQSGPESNRDQLWCGTTGNVDRDDKWGYCDVDNDTYTESGQLCLFPFSYRGITFSQCTTYDAYPADELRLWCAISETGEWDYCIVTAYDANSTTNISETVEQEDDIATFGNENHETETMHPRDVDNSSTVKEQMAGVVWKMWLLIYVGLFLVVLVVVSTIVWKYSTGTESKGESTKLVN